MTDQPRPPLSPSSAAAEPAAGAPPDPEDERRRDAVERPPRKQLSDLLEDIAYDPSREVIQIRDLMHHLGGRARAALIFVFAFPNALPAIPGTSGILGLPLLYLTFQMMLGRMPWLPRIIADRGLPREKFALLVAKLVPTLSRVERLLKPRWQWLVGPNAEKALGFVCLVLAVVLTLPVPLGNMLPAFAICLIALGVLDKDGVWTALGLVVAAGALIISFGVIYAMVWAAYLVVRSAFG